MLPSFLQGVAFGAGLALMSGPMGFMWQSFAIGAQWLWQRRKG